MSNKINTTEWFDIIDFLNKKSDEVKVFRQNESSKHTFIFNENETDIQKKVIFNIEYTEYIDNDDSIYFENQKEFLYTCSFSLEDKEPYVIFTLKSGEYQGFDMGVYIDKKPENYIFDQPYKKVISYEKSEYSPSVLYFDEKLNKHVSSFIPQDEFDRKDEGFYPLDENVKYFENTVDGFNEFKKSGLSVDFDGEPFVDRFVEKLKYWDYKKVTKEKALRAIMNEDIRMFMLGETPDSIGDTLARERMFDSYDDVC